MADFPQMALFLMVALPALGAVLVLLFARQGLAQIRRLVLTIVVVASYDPNLKNESGQPQLIQMRTTLPWVETIDSQGKHLVGPDIHFDLGVDGLSLWLIFLSATLMIPSVLVSWEAVQDR